MPVTTKQEDAPMHGIGLANVRREAEKYMGELELKAVQQEFSATVLLQERSSL
nr:GHKL domain-containing protein [uncultured Acetatifactor sp.]